mgnify:CR=1 FL=1
MLQIVLRTNGSAQLVFQLMRYRGTGMSVLEKRFGTVAVENMLITKEQLQEALKIQVDDDIDGREHRLVGSILEDLGYMAKADVNKILIHLEGRQNL